MSLHQFQRGNLDLGRVVALALLADGHLPAAGERLLPPAALTTLGISEAQFRALVDALGAGPALTGAAEGALLDRVREPGARIAACRIILQVLDGDGHLSRGELAFFGRLMARWGLTLEDLRAARGLAA